MKRLFLSLFAICIAMGKLAAQDSQKNFAGLFVNDEYNIYLKIDLYSKGIEVPEHEMFGLLPGYLGKKNNNFYWLITSFNVKSNKTANLEFINDYGSEDFIASISKKNDSTFILKQITWVAYISGPPTLLFQQII